MPSTTASRAPRSPSLRIAVVHSFYRSGSPSGENQAVLEQVEALRRVGHRAHLVALHTDRLSRSVLYPLQAAATVSTGRGRTPLTELRRLRPDVVHVHNLYPNFGRSWVRHWNGPLVATVHNYRPMCAAATLYRNGATCTLCLDGNHWAGLRNRCYRGSRAATAPLAWAGRRGAAADPLLRRADRVVVLSAASRRMYLRAGITPQRLALVPNFTAEVPDPQPTGTGPQTPDTAEAAWVFAGRLSAEKGPLELLARWPATARLDIVGEGPLLHACRRAAPHSVRFLGALPHTELRRRLPSWRGLVFPSRCLEGATPLIYTEALAAGLPVLAFTGSAVADTVHEHGTGTVVDWQDPLDTALTRAAALFPALRSHCRGVFLRHHTEHLWTARIEAVYAAAQAHRAAVRDNRDIGKTRPRLSEKA